MSSAVYNFADHTKGDTFKGLSFTVNVNAAPISITDVKMELKKNENAAASLSLTVGSGITLSATPGRFSIDKQIIDIPAGRYEYDIEITVTGGDKFTYIKGSWTINRGVTNG
jgi:hypothetical protein